MISLRFPIAPKMQKFAMTKCVSTISGIADIVETFLPSPPKERATEESLQGEKRRQVLFFKPTSVSLLSGGPTKTGQLWSILPQKNENPPGKPFSGKE
jgi:hypothetical protein